jgi:hypothetical protein
MGSLAPDCGRDVVGRRAEHTAECAAHGALVPEAGLAGHGSERKRGVFDQRPSAIDAQPLDEARRRLGEGDSETAGEVPRAHPGLGRQALHAQIGGQIRAKPVEQPSEGIGCGQLRLEIDRELGLAARTL